MPTGSIWSRDELLLTLNLYNRIPFGRIHHANPEVVSLATMIDRTPSAVAMRLANFAALDPALERRGMPHVSAGVTSIWAEFQGDPEALAFESETLLAQRRAPSLLETALDGLPDGLERERIVKTRVNQAFFRRLVLARYDGTCCITGLKVTKLLVAAHIVPWAEEERERMNPRNALCLNALHDRAFEVGLIVIDDHLRVRVHPSLLTENREPEHSLLARFDGVSLQVAGDMTPDATLLRRHRQRFQW